MATSLSVGFIILAVTSTCKAGTVYPAGLSPLELVKFSRPNGRAGANFVLAQTTDRAAEVVKCTPDPPAVSPAWHASKLQAEKGIVTIYAHHDTRTPQAVLGRAKLIATSIFASIGVPVVWRSGGIRQLGGEGAVSIEMQLDAGIGAQFRPGSLAYAVPYVNSGTRIHVFIDRVLKDRLPDMAGILLGYVMVHEITHVLQGMERHSAEGIMKATWDEHDHHAIFLRKLPFAAIDARLIHAALGINDACLAGRVDDR
jgi:hypothetical protein